MKKEALILMAAIVFLILGGLIYYYNTRLIPQAVFLAETKIKNELDDNSMPKVKAAVVADINGIPKYTVLTGDVLSEKVKIVEVPLKYALKTAINDIELINGKIAKEDLRFNEQIAADSLSADAKWFGEFERLKEYSISNTVAGQLGTGNIVDILVNYQNGDYDVVVPKIKVHRLVETEAKTPGNDKNVTKSSTSSTATVILAVDEVQYQELELAGRLGKLEVRLYLDESQPPSSKTFDYPHALVKARLDGISEKAKGVEPETTQMKLMN